MATPSSTSTHTFSLTLSGTVIQGTQQAQLLGYPTANIVISDDELSVEGVFHIQVHVHEKSYEGIGNYFREKGIFESHLFDFSGNLYGEHIQVIILRKIRDNQPFSSREALVEQIEKDIGQIRA